MNLIFRALSTLILSFAIVSICQADISDFAQQITEANIYYQNKQYPMAAKTYEDLVNKGYKDGYLYYNLGNTYYRLGQMGPAILNYLRAKSLIPRDKDLEANLKSAYLETMDHLEGKQSNNIFLFWLDDFNQVETIQALVLSSLIFWITMIFQLFFKTGFWSIARSAMLCLLLLTAISAGAKHYWSANNLACVVLAKTIEVKSLPGSDSVTLYQLHEGAVLSVLETKDDWYKVELPDDKRGWVKKESVGI